MISSESRDSIDAELALGQDAVPSRCMRELLVSEVETSFFHYLIQGKGGHDSVVCHAST